MIFLCRFTVAPAVAPQGSAWLIHTHIMLRWYPKFYPGLNWLHFDLTSSVSSQTQATLKLPTSTQWFIFLCSPADGLCVFWPLDWIWDGCFASQGVHRASCCSWCDQHRLAQGGRCSGRDTANHVSTQLSESYFMMLVTWITFSTVWHCW